MGAPRKDDRGLSFKEKLQLAIAEVDDSSCSWNNNKGATTKDEGLRNSPIKDFKTLQLDGTSIKISNISPNWSNNISVVNQDNRLLFNLSILETTANNLQNEKDKTESLYTDLANLESKVEEKETELAELRKKFDEKVEKEKELINQNEKLRLEFEMLKKSSHPEQSDVSTQVENTEFQSVCRPNSINIARWSPHQETPPQLSPVLSSGHELTKFQPIGLSDNMHSSAWSQNSDSQRTSLSPRARVVYPACSSKRQHLNASPQDLKPFLVSSSQEIIQRVENNNKICNGMANKNKSSNESRGQQNSSSSESDENFYGTSGGGGGGFMGGETRPHFTKHNFLICKQTNIGVLSPLSSPTTNANSISAIPDSSNTHVSSTTNNSTNSSSKKRKITMENHKEIPKTSLIISETENCMTTKTPYYINEMEDRMSEMLREAEESPPGKSVEVPQWRIRKYQPLVIEGEESASSEEIEELNDNVFLKRHQRLEIDEKRRKRWDSQRVREETYLERLKRRMQERERQKTKRRKAAAGRRVGPGGSVVKVGESDDDQELESVHPIAEDILYIRVSEDIPISVFGHPMPIVERSEFELPWSPRGKTPINSPPRPPSSSSSVSSLPSLPSPTTIPHLRKRSPELPRMVTDFSSNDNDCPPLPIVDSSISQHNNSRSELVSAFLSTTPRNPNKSNSNNVDMEEDVDLFKR